MKLIFEKIFNEDALTAHWILELDCPTMELLSEPSKNAMLLQCKNIERAMHKVKGECIFILKYCG